MIVRDDAASLPVLPEFPVLDDVAFRDLLIEWDGLAGTHSRLKPIVDPLLAVAAAVHEEQLFPQDTWSDWSADDLVGLLNRTAEIGLRGALSFTPPRYFDVLWRDCNKDPGKLAARCEALFACHVARSGTPRAAEYVEGYALLIEIWRSARAEELRRVVENPVGVILVMLLRGGPESQRALGILTDPAAAGEIPALRGVVRALNTLDRANLAQSLFARWDVDKGRRRYLARQDAHGDLNEAIAQRLADLKTLSVRDLYVRLLGDGFERLPHDLIQAAQGKLRKARAKKRRPRIDRSAPGACPFCGTEIPPPPCVCSRCNLAIPRDPQDTAFTQVPANLTDPEPSDKQSGSAVAKVLKLIEQRLGQEKAQIVAEVASGATMRDAAARRKASEKTIQRIFHELRTDQGLLADILALFRQ